MQKFAFASYESPYAPGGGISAVMSHLPRALQTVAQADTYVISPFHKKIPKTRDISSKLRKVGTIGVIFDDQQIKVDILMLAQDVQWIFLKPHILPGFHPPFFDGKNHPYDISSNRRGQSILLRDSLFFGKAITSTLPVIDPSCTWKVILQDWETATTCFCLHDSHLTADRSTFYLILHNFYDSGITPDDFVMVGAEPNKFPGKTVLQCALPFVSDPIFTVSDQFAEDFTNEILISKIMVPHIIDDLTPRLVGVNNGIFKDPIVPDVATWGSKKNGYTQFLKWKSANREAAYHALDNLTNSNDTPVWGNLSRFIRDDSPWFVMAGRDDSRQKGYEIACTAVHNFLSDGGSGRFIFFPIPGEEGLPGIEFIKILAEQYPTSVLCLPFLLRQGFFAILQGSTYGLMPSYYEPFGMANEFYLSGVVCIGRATGGILQQVVPYRGSRSFSQAVESRSDKLHSASSPPTGLLFRESDDIASALLDWREFNEAKYEIGNGLNRQLQRDKLPLFQSMANELTLAIQDGVNIYSENQELYFEMLVNGFSFVQQNFDWEKSAQTYYKYIG